MVQVDKFVDLFTHREPQTHLETTLEGVNPAHILYSKLSTNAHHMPFKFLKVKITRRINFNKCFI